MTQSTIHNPQSSILKVGGTPVGEFLLLPFGMVRMDAAVSGGDFTFTAAMARQAVAWFKTLSRKLVIDYEHQTFDDMNIRPDGRRPAAGWISKLEIRGDGLWAAGVEWTAAARALLASGEYLYFSPVIFWTDTKYTTIRALGPVGLTNDPALKQLPALVATRVRGRPIVTKRQARTPGANPAPRGMYTKGGPKMDQIKELLGLAPEASLEDVLAAVNEENRAALAEALGLPAEATVEEVKAAIEALVEPEPEPEAEPAAEEVVTAARKQAAGATVATIAKALGVEADSPATLVAAVRRQLLKAGFDTHTQALLKRLGVLEAASGEHAWQAFLVGPAAGKLTPAMQPIVKRMFTTDRAQAEKLVAEMVTIASGKSMFAGDGSAGGAAGGEDDPARLEKEWTQNRPDERGVPLQREFGSKEAFFAFKRQHAAGHVKILKGKAE